ncbi:MAG: S-adenosyl-l-methionine hydroxide adenosyltransferase [Actinobacteria bacterium ADurb.Bin444]|nr:MAG: S-adenosyl-l-methionine hydroxide adenosyltransferase [Actinobacteria bacterium ADurb.Bin444]
MGTRGGPRAHRLTMVSTYTDLRSGQLGLLADSWGLAAIAQRDGRAADTLGVDLHDTVTLLPAEPKPADP